MRLGKAGEAYFIENSNEEDTDLSSPQDSPRHSPKKSLSPLDMSSEEEKIEGPISPKEDSSKFK